MSRLTVPLLFAPVLALAHCSPPPPSPQARADAATLAACREHADTAYNRNNRDSIYTISSANSPYSANYTPGLVTRGLAQRYGFENMVRDCVRNTGADTDPTATATPALPPPPPPITP
jgi:hypothetical protein